MTLQEQFEKETGLCFTYRPKDCLVKRKCEYPDVNYCYHSDNYIEWLEPKVPQWISTKERLPENNGWYLVCYKNEDINFALWNIMHKQWHIDNTWHKAKVFSHWMQLPEPPKE